ncbi:XK-related protein 8-like [Chanos chanos]|uniref:XK-related protein n=1 Tax=Chanos chanos TaxID=29144 RepID=A0A6J2WV57_CHACN|nr:XK-related protein 8-like [Chanos chanos]
MAQGNTAWLFFKNLLTIVGFFFFLLDIALDMLAIYSFYQEEDYVSMGVLIFVLVGSSVVLQLFSWMWNANPVISIWKEIRFFQGDDKQQNHTLSILRLFEMFTESIPQLCLMVSTVFIKKKLELITALKIAGSVVAVTISALTFHRGMCASQSDTCKKSWGRSVIYSLWNLLLISARVTALALFASVLPIFALVHFLARWMSFTLWVWLEPIKFMDSRAGKWLYRATIGLIFYFSWLKVTKESGKLNSVLYHVVIIGDTGLLIGVWWWQMVCEDAMFAKPLIVVSAVVSFYLVGLAFEMVYYYWPDCKCEADLRLCMTDDTND